jgi:hypothetical protein
MSHENEGKGTAKVWSHAIDIMSKDKTFAISITSCELPPKFPGAIPLTHYTWELVRFYDGKKQRHFQFVCSIEDGIASVEQFPADELKELLSEAREWVRGQRQKREDLLTERRLSNAQPKGLKELRKADAKKYQKNM